jgi:hypothetical protein
MFAPKFDAWASAFEIRTAKARNQQRLFRGISYGFLWKFCAFAQHLKMLCLISKMPLEKKDKGKRVSLTSILFIIDYIFVFSFWLLSD